MQTLGVRPHTVFWDPKEPRSPRADTTHRNSLAVPRTPILGGTPRTSRLNSIDHSTRDGTAVEDLRRRLAQMDGSTTSLTSQSVVIGTRARRESITSVTSALPSPAPTDISSHPLPSPFDTTPGSPSESVMSGGIDVLRRKHQKAAPSVVASVNTNIAGVLEAPKVRTAEEEALTSGRTSPMSMAGTIRGQPRMSSRRTSGLPFTSYGMAP